MASKSKKREKKAKPAVKKVAKKPAVRKMNVTKSEGPLVPLHDRVVVRHLSEAEAGTANSFGRK